MSFRYVTVMILLRTEDINTKAFNCEFFRYDVKLYKFEVIMSFKYDALLFT